MYHLIRSLSLAALFALPLSATAAEYPVPVQVTCVETCPRTPTYVFMTPEYARTTQDFNIPPEQNPSATAKVVLNAPANANPLMQLMISGELLFPQDRDFKVAPKVHRIIDP